MAYYIWYCYDDCLFEEFGLFVEMVLLIVVHVCRLQDKQDEVTACVHCLGSDDGGVHCPRSTEQVGSCKLIFVITVHLVYN